MKDGRQSRIQAIERVEKTLDEAWASLPDKPDLLPQDFVAAAEFKQHWIAVRNAARQDALTWDVVLHAFHLGRSSASLASGEIQRDKGRVPSSRRAGRRVTWLCREAQRRKLTLPLAARSPEKSALKAAWREKFSLSDAQWRSDYESAVALFAQIADA